MDSLGQLLLGLILIIGGLLGPIVVTIYNIYRLFFKQLVKSYISAKFACAKEEKPAGKTKPFLMDLYTIVGGFVLSFIALEHITSGEWYIAICELCDYHHNALSSAHLVSFLLPAAFAIIALFLLRAEREYPPIITLLIYAFVYIGMILSVLWIIQLWSDISSTSSTWFITTFLIIYPLNYLILSFYYLKQSIQRLSNGRSCKMGKFIYKSCNTWAWAFVVLIPVCGVLVAILTLFGQSPDSIVQVFTQTAGWTFSQQVPPPPLDHTGHYLCTVAAKGKKSIVKPLFVGKRHGRPIVVNRQLQIANAFEDLLAEKMPKVHKKLRRMYDNYGYPISRFINTPTRSTLMYVAMKPVEWLFILVLYTTDIKPEKRIGRQYT